jgi:NADPH:quinone reductase-like Zn-dependent oxidoreductase
MTKIPENYSFEEAACVLDGLMLAQNYIRKIDFAMKPKIMINGATGSIGTACLQLAKINGAEVTAVGNTKNLDLLKSLGADRVIDFTQSDFTLDSEKYDFVIDAVGKSTFFKCKKILKPKGVYFSTELGPYGQNVYLPLLTFFSTGKKIKFPIPTDNRALIEYFASIIASGKYKAIIDSEYSLEQTAAAHRYVEAGQKTGNVLIRIS